MSRNLISWSWIYQNLNIKIWLYQVYTKDIPKWMFIPWIYYGYTKTPKLVNGYCFPDVQNTVLGRDGSP